MGKHVHVHGLCLPLMSSLEPPFASGKIIYLYLLVLSSIIAILFIIIVIKGIVLLASGLLRDRSISLNLS